MARLIFFKCNINLLTRNIRFCLQCGVMESLSWFSHWNMVIHIYSGDPLHNQTELSTTAAHHRAAHNHAARWCAGLDVCNLPRQLCRLGDAHNRASTLSSTGCCAARWCAAGLCAIRLGCVEGHPWYMQRRRALPLVLVMVYRQFSV